MKSKFLYILYMTSTLMSYSQFKSIKGHVQDEQGNDLESATVFFNTTDDELIAYTFSNSSGEFFLEFDFKEIEGVIHVSHIGLSKFQKKINIENVISLNLGQIILKPELHNLDEIILSGKAPPVIVKKDTIEFNVGSFQKKSTKILEDLLLEIPNVELDTNGDLLINGKSINTILINGESFFKNDTKIALKNIPVEILDKIQVVDYNSEKAIIKKTISNSRMKTLNLVLKKDFEKQIFGKFSQGLGNKRRYQATGITNYFDNIQRISLLGGANNIDNPGFSYNDLKELGKNAKNLSWRGNKPGISKSEDIGINFSKKVSSKLSIIGEYFYSSINIVDNRTINRNYYLPESDYNRFNHLFNDTNDKSHKANISFKYNLKNSLNVLMNTEIDFNKQIEKDSVFSTSTLESGEKINEILSHFIQPLDTREIANEILLTKKINTNLISLSYDFHLSKKDSERNLASSYISAIDTTAFNRNQSIQNIGNDNTSLLGFEYKKKVSDFINFKLIYDYSNFTNSFKRTAYDLVGVDFEKERNDRLSINIDTGFSYHEPSFGIEYDKNKLEFSLDLIFQSSKLRIYGDFFNTQNYQDKLLSSYLKYSFSKEKAISFSYDIKTKLPPIRYLYSIPDETRQDEILIGNHKLGREKAYVGSLYFNDFKIDKRFTFFAEFNIIKNGVGIMSNINEELIQEKSYINFNNLIRASLRSTIRKTIKLRKGTIQYSTGINSRFFRNYSLINGIKYQINQFFIYPTVRMYLKKDNTLQINYNPRYIITNYSPRLFYSQNIFSHQINIESTTKISKKISLENVFQFNQRPNIGEGFSEKNILWNMSLEAQILNNGLLKFYFFDILNQNTNTYRISNENYFQDSFNNVINRYFLVSLSFDFQKK